MTFKLSEEQERILQQAQPPGVGRTVRITSAAGTGKTTTLLKLAERFSQLGHDNIAYITFNKSAAGDARKRLAGTLSSRISVDARTLHSCAMSLLAKHRSETETPEGQLMNEENLQKEILRISQRDIDNFLADCFREIDKKTRSCRARQESMRENAERQVVFFLFKTLKQFCQSDISEEDWHDPALDRKRNYYPATLYHRVGGDGEKSGFLPVHYSNRVRFYAEQACKLWTLMKDIKSYDFEMKRAQLLGIQIPGTALLVDECQDMDGCQVDWVASQVKHNKQVFFVGDAAQTIYSFRGAKSRYMMNLKGGVTDCTLTNSWRFGPAIAKIANVVLFAKEKSPQTTGYTKTWQPYRVTGAGATTGTVTAESLLPLWKTQKLTLLAHANVALLIEAVSMLGFEKPSSEDGAADGADVVPSTPFDPTMIPKFHINGRGENSGMKKWKQVISQIEHLYRLFAAPEDGYLLPPAQFPEFANRKLTWKDFSDQVKDRELNRYTASVMVVESFRENTAKAMQMFEENVTRMNYSAEEADIILSTVHAAKGMEWDHVQVCSDFVDLAKVDNFGPPCPKNNKPDKNGWYAKRSKPNDSRNSWQFSFKGYGDDVNLLYVACTRAKKTLCVPKTVLRLLQECDLLHQLLDARVGSLKKSEDDEGKTFLFGSQKSLTHEDLQSLNADVLSKLRQECKVYGSQLLCDSLFSDQLSAHDGGNADKEHVDRKAPYSTTHQKQEVGAIQEVIVIDDTPTPPKVASKTWQNPKKEPEIIVIE
jgi:superfamily I DNA/RNA helicase